MHVFSTLWKLGQLIDLLVSAGKLPNNITLAESFTPIHNCAEYRLNSINNSVLLGYTESGCTQNIWLAVEYFEHHRTLNDISSFVFEDKQLINLTLTSNDDNGDETEISIDASIQGVNDIIDHAAAVVDEFHKLSSVEQRALAPSLADAISELEEPLEVYLDYQSPN